MNKFKVGDVVQLNSWSPLMTVVDEGIKEGDILCAWYEKEGGDFKRASFPETALKLAPNSND